MSLNVSGDGALSGLMDASIVGGGQPNLLDFSNATYSGWIPLLWGFC